jgi:hypothetical protein
MIHWKHLLTVHNKAKELFQTKIVWIAYAHCVVLMKWLSVCRFEIQDGRSCTKNV